MADARDRDAALPRSRPWYADGLRFRCQPDCGACCTNHDDYAYVYLAREDVRRIARFLGLGRREFLERHTTTDDGHVVLSMERPSCPFLDGARCAIYPVRPVQCRTFPFWDENLKSPAAWRSLRRFCPGVGAGEPVSRTEIEADAERARAIDPAEEP